MSVSIGGKIVTDGLIVHYDALNGKSYPGSGTNWYNLGPKASYSGSLAGAVNPPTIANGYASFVAGDDSYVNINNLSEFTATTPTKATIDMWVKINPSSQNYRYLFGWNQFFIIVRTNDNPPSIGTGANLQDLYGVDTLDSLGVIGKWAHYSIVMVNSDPDTVNLPLSDNRIYINSLNQTPLTQLTGTPYSSRRVFDNDARIGGFRFGAGTIISDDLEIAVVKVYNRELTQVEVTQNFNAHKGRFNIY